MADANSDDIQDYDDNTDKNTTNEKVDNSHSEDDPGGFSQQASIGPTIKLRCRSVSFGGKVEKWWLSWTMTDTAEELRPENQIHLKNTFSTYFMIKTSNVNQIALC